MWFIKKIYKYNSELNGKIIVSDNKNRKILFSGGVTQSGGELVEMWETVSKRIKKDLPTSKSCLVLGVAGGTFISSISKMFPNIKIIGIEIDYKMLETYNKHFRNGRINLKLENADALIWVKKYKNKFDLIVVDLYIGRYNPKKARHRRFLCDLSKLLKKNGILIYNSHYDDKNKKDFELFRNKIEDFFDIEIIYEFPLNKMLLLTRLQRGKSSNPLRKDL